MKTADGRLIVVGGASRSGKSAKVAQDVRPHPHVIAWDPEAQWCKLPGWKTIRSKADLVAAIAAGKGKYAYVPAGLNLPAEFDGVWCRGIFIMCGRDGFRGPLTIIGEELADVSTPAKAPPYWGMCCRRLLKRGVTIYAVSQRWAEADKTALGNASEFIVFRQATVQDARYMASRTRLDLAAIDALVPLEFMHFECGTFATKKGRLKFK